MSKQRFSSAFREAIWRAFGRHCFYCELPLLFAEMEIDHIIPESTEGDELKAYRARLGLPAAFDVFGFENLAPTCTTCNAAKRALPLSDGALMIKLAQIAGRRARLLEELEKKRVSRELDAVLRTIEHSIAANKFSMDELSRRIEWLRKHPDGFHGASGQDRTPPSPEVSYLGIHFLDDGSVTLTPQALDDLQRLELSERDLLEKIRAFGTTGQIKLRRLAGEAVIFELRLKQDLRLSFTFPSERETTILGVYREADHERPR